MRLVAKFQEYSLMGCTENLLLIAAANQLLDRLVQPLGGLQMGQLFTQSLQTHLVLFFLWREIRKWVNVWVQQVDPL